MLLNDNIWMSKEKYYDQLIELDRMEKEAAKAKAKAEAEKIAAEKAEMHKKEIQAVIDKFQKIIDTAEKYGVSDIFAADLDAMRSIMKNPERENSIQACLKWADRVMKNVEEWA